MSFLRTHTHAVEIPAVQQAASYKTIFILYCVIRSRNSTAAEFETMIWIIQIQVPRGRICAEFWASVHANHSSRSFVIELKTLSRAHLFLWCVLNVVKRLLHRIFQWKKKLVAAATANLIDQSLEIDVALDHTIPANNSMRTAVLLQEIVLN